jgi:hypothetical protein
MGGACSTLEIIRSVYKILGGKLKWRRQFGRPRCKKGINKKIILKK